MPGQTSPDDLVFPLIGDNVSPRVAITQLADSVQAALNDIHAGADRQVDFYGPTAALTSTTPKQGDTYRESDSLKRLWIYDGANWVTNEGGMYLIRPASVANATVAADGSVTPNNGASSVAIDGIFSARFRTYKIIFQYRTAAVASGYMQFRTGGVPYGTTNYSCQRMQASNTTVTADQAINVGYWQIGSAAGAQSVAGEITIVNPALNASKYYTMTIANQGSTSLGTIAGNNTGATASIFDGIQFVPNSTYDTSVPGSFFKIYGLA